MDDLHPDRREQHHVHEADGQLQHDERDQRARASAPAAPRRGARTAIAMTARRDPIAKAGCSTRSRMSRCDVAEGRRAAPRRASRGEERVAERGDGAADAGHEDERRASASSETRRAPVRREPRRAAADAHHAVSARHASSTNVFTQVHAP